MDHFSKEADFEHALIEALQRYGWEYTGQDRQIHDGSTRGRTGRFIRTRRS